jgi:hypothetical protein
MSGLIVLHNLASQLVQLKVSYDVLISNVPKEKELRKPEAYNMDKRFLESLVTKYK